MPANQEDIDANGDVILVVGEDKKRLRVSSMMLSAASPVFKALLGPHFREGQQARSTSNPIEITLPDDASNPTTWLCSLLHHKGAAELEANTNTRTLLEFAVLVDKYDCTAALRLQARALLRVCHDNKATSNVAAASHLEAVAAAYYLQDPVSFRTSTCELITCNTGNLVKLHGHQPMLPDNVFMSIEAKRSEARDLFINEVMALARCPYEPHPYDYEGVILKMVKDLGSAYWPPFSQSHGGTTLEKTCQVLKDFGRHRRACGSCANGNEYEPTFVHQRQLNSAWDRVSALCDGLCLECAREGAADLMKNCKRHN